MARAKAQPTNRTLFWWIGALPRLALRWLWRGVLLLSALALLWIGSYSFINPPTTAYIMSEGLRLGEIRRDWRDLDDISEHMARAAVAAEDANFCNHWGFDMAAIRLALQDGAGRGASTISQQTVKNAFLWHGRNWYRKALEALMTPAVEAIWSKRRVLEIYLNIAEFDEGVFGVAAAAQWYFGVDARDLTLQQASLLAAILPAPKTRSARDPSLFVKKRGRSIASGAETIRVDGRSACFES